MKKINKALMIVLCGLFSFLTLNVVKADEVGNVARIGEIEYATLDEAVKAAVSGDVIVLLNNATTEGLNLSKDLTIESENSKHYKIDFTKYGIALWGKSLTFKDVDVTMSGIGSTPYTAEWNWMTICASKNSELSLINSNMTMDGANTGNKHAIYFTGNDKLNITNSNLVIKNYQQDALEWDGGDGGYNVNIVNSTFLSDHNRSGFTGTFIVTVDNSKVNVVNNTGNGSNGSHFVTIDSEFNFSNNGSCGLSAGSVNSTNTNFTLNNNGMAGLVISSASVSSKFDKDSEVYIDNNGANIYGAFLVAADVTFESGSVLKVTNNKTVGIRVLDGILSWTGSASGKGTLKVLEGVTLEITKNVNNKEIVTSRVPTNYSGSTYGGGIWANGTVVLPSDAVIYNNHSLSAGDDIYLENGANITFGSVGNDWYLDGEPDCTDKITGWFDDAKDTRWDAHQSDLDNNHIVEVDAGTYSNTEDGLAIKAAHGLSTVNVHYVTVDGEVLHDVITMTGVVGSEYATELLDFYGYKLSKTEGELTGKFASETIEVTYIYERAQGTVISNYVDVDGNKLADSVTDIGYVGDKYKTEFKDIFGYKLVEIKGDDIGTFEEDTIYVTYVYLKEMFGKGGDDLESDIEILPPQTGLDVVNTTSDNKNIAIISIIIALGFVLMRSLNVLKIK